MQTTANAFYSHCFSLGMAVYHGGHTVADVPVLITGSARDVFPLIGEALRRRSASAAVSRSILPTNCAHVKMLLRLIVTRTVNER